MANQSETKYLLARVAEQTSSGLLFDAEASCLRLLDLSPSEPKVWLQLGMLRMRSGRLADAESALRRAVALSPQGAPCWSLLGAVLFHQNRLDESAHASRQALAIDPRDAETWSTLGATLWRLGDLAAADEAYQRSLEISAEDLPTLTNYARLLLERRQPEQALKVLEKVLTRDPALVTAWLSTGDAFLIGGDYRQAAIAHRHALELAPGDRGILRRVAETLVRHGQPEDAEPLVQRILADEPRSPAAWALLAVLRERQVRTAEAAEALRNSLLLEPNAYYHSNLLNILHYGEGATAASLLKAHRDWDAAYAAPLFPKSPSVMQADAASRPLRLGFVSSHFGQHPTAFLVLPVVESLDKTQCTVFCYSDRPEADEYTARFRAAADEWRNCAGATDEQLAQQIQRDRIDILFDLMGHNGKRLLVFARKPAPIQISWLGYVGTTGMAAMNFLLADRYHVRPGEEGHYAESVLRMPKGYACYGPPPNAPPVAPLPALATGQVTFGSFNNPAKISPSTIHAWAGILRRVPSARLFLKYKGFEQEQLRDRVKVEFAQRNIDIGRIILEGKSPHDLLLQAYNRVDVALDTQPYSGGLTTCEALWMGVPVISCGGKTFAGRHSASHLTNAGFSQFLADNLNDYVDLAVRWAGQLDDLAQIRSTMRAQVRNSHLCDGRGFAREFHSLLKQVWEARTTSHP